MSDFDDRARASGKRIRREAADLAADVDPLECVGASAGSGARRSGGRGRVVVAAAAALIAVGGIAGLLLAGNRETADDTDLVATTESAATTSVPTTSTPAPETTSTTTSTTSTTTTTTTLPQPTSLIRPIVDPAVCEPISATGGTPTGLPRDTFSNLPLTLFAMPSEFPVPIQIIGDPVDGQAKPFAVLLRFVDREQQSVGAGVSESINGVDVSVNTFGNGNGHASWTLPDGTTAYLRSRGLDRSQLLAIASQLTPRPVDAPIPGFDYASDGAPAGVLEGLELVGEGMNTDPREVTYAGSQCRVPSTDFVYRVGAYTGPAIFTYGAVIDRPVPVDVGVVGESVVLISGGEHPTAPTVDDILDADEETWRDLLLAPEPDTDRLGQPISQRDLAVELVPIDDAATPISNVILRVEVTDGVASLVVDKRGAVVADDAEYWKIEIDGRIRSRTTAIPGPDMGVAGIRLIDTDTAPFGYEFTARISTTDGDDQTIQTTREIRLVLSLEPT